ncbi:MAG: DUF4209 domain-containing protein, partial [Hyphomicrobium sp.]
PQPSVSKPMTVLVPPLAELVTAVAAAKEPDASSLASAFSAAKAQSGEDHWDLLIQVFQMMLRSRNLAEPFGSISTYGDRRSMIPSDLTDTELQALRSLHPGPDHPGYRARIGDLLWLRERDAQAGEMAADAYVKLGEILQTSPHPHEAGEHFERGVRLGMQINRKGEQVQRHLDHIHVQAIAADPATYGRLPADLLALLYDLRHGDAAQLGERCMAVGVVKRNIAHYPAARTTFDLAAKFFHRAKQSAAAEAAAIASAESHVDEANGFANGLGAHNSIRAAILAFQKIPSCRDRIPSLQQRLRASAQSALASMTTIDHKDDITPLVEETRRAISGVALIDAVFRLAFATPLLKQDEMRTQVEKNLADSPLQAMFQTTVFDAAGRTVAVVPGMLGGTDAEVELGMQHHVYRYAGLGRNLTCAACIGPALGVINAEHTIDETDIAPLLEDHPLIADGHTQYFARGLTEGLRGDFALALHFLVPQIENSLRIILHSKGVITTELTKVGIEQEWTLGRVLAQPALEVLLGPSFVFELKSLMLADPVGANIRNTLAHGLLPYRSANTVDCVYLWWVILRILIRTSPQFNALAEGNRTPDHNTT